MKHAFHFLPSLAAAAACSTSSTTATVQLDPQAGWNGSAEVLVHTAGGALVSRAPITTSLAVDIIDGDTVTISLVGGGQTQLLSNFDVQRGDLIELPAYPMGTASTTSVAVNFPSVPGATMWEVATPYTLSDGDVASQQSVDVPPGATTTAIVATAYDATGALAMYADTKAPVTGQPPSVTLQAPTPFRAVTIDTIDVPADVMPGNVFSGGAVYLGNDGISLAQIGNDAVMPTSFGDRVGFESIAFGTTDAVSVGLVQASVPTGPVTIDLSAPAVPQVAGLTLSPAAISWTLTGGGTYDYVSADLSSSTDASYYWSLVAPPATAAITLPQLPADLATPTFDELGVGVTRDSDLSGYADALHEPLAPSAGQTFQVRSASIVPSSARRVPRRAGVPRAMSQLAR